MQGASGSPGGKGGPLLRRSGRRHWLRHPWQAALAVSGIAMGVAMVVAVDLASGSARAAYRLATETLAGRATHRILGLSGDLPDSLYAVLRLAGLRDAAGNPPPMVPVLEARAEVLPRPPGPGPAQGRGTRDSGRVPGTSDDVRGTGAPPSPGRRGWTSA